MRFLGIGLSGGFRAPPIHFGALLMESGDVLLIENGDLFDLE